MSNEKMFDATPIAQIVLNTNAPKGEKTGAHPEKPLISAFNDIIDGYVEVLLTPKRGLNMVKERLYSADELREIIKYFKTHPVAKQVLEHLYGNVTFTELVTTLEKNMVVSFIAGAGTVLISREVYDYFTNDESKAKREEKRTERYIKQLEKSGYIVVPPDDGIKVLETTDFEF